MGGAAAQEPREIWYRAAIISFSPALADPPRNIARIESLAREAIAAGARVIVVPEQSTSGFEITKDQAPSLAIEAPFKDLAGLEAMAQSANAVIALGIVEKAGDHIFNSAAVILPSGTIATQRKRLFSASFGWNDRGDSPIDVFDTPYGKLAVLICADSFLINWTRIAAIKGAEVLLLPSNWWGANEQLELWKARAKEEGFWILAANRWGSEPNLFPPPTRLYMSDGPTAALNPDGNVVAVFQADQDAPMADRIVYADVVMPAGRKPPYTVSSRRPEAYSALTSKNYTPGAPAPADLPTPGKEAFASSLTSLAPTPMQISRPSRRC